MTYTELIENLHGVYQKKNLAYGNSAHNTYEIWGPVSYLVRITDKLHRMKQISSRPDIDIFDESLFDTIGDCVTYLIMLAADSFAKDRHVNQDTYENEMESVFHAVLTADDTERGNAYRAWKAYLGMIELAPSAKDLSDMWRECSPDNGYKPLFYLIYFLAEEYIALYNLMQEEKNN